jgi:hypothetical protein
MREIELAPDLHQPVDAGDALVVAQAPRIVVADVLQARHLGRRFEHLVDLLLVLDDGVDDLGVVEHIGEFRRRSVLVHRHRDAAQRLRRRHRPIEARPVVADDRQVHSTPEAERGEAARERAHLRGDLTPRPRLPDAEILLARCGRIRPQRRVVHQESRKSVDPIMHRLSPILFGRTAPGGTRTRVHP